MAFFSSHSFMQETFGEHWAKSWRSQEEWETTWPAEASYPSGVGWSQLQCVAPCLCFVKGTAYSPPSKKNKTKRNSLPPRIQKLLYHLPRSFGTLSSSFLLQISLCTLVFLILRINTNYSFCTAVHFLCPHPAPITQGCPPQVMWLFPTNPMTTPRGCLGIPFSLPYCKARCIHSPDRGPYPRLQEQK